jgi:hypothetical protein
MANACMALSDLTDITSDGFRNYAKVSLISST